MDSFLRNNPETEILEPQLSPELTNPQPSLVVRTERESQPIGNSGERLSRSF